jgi:colicin import membrane protein
MRWSAKGSNPHHPRDPRAFGHWQPEYRSAKHLTAWREARPWRPPPRQLPQALTAAIAAEIERAAAQARAEIEGRLVQAQGEAAELAAAGEVIEAERDALAEQVAELTRGRDTLAGKAEQQAVDLADQAQRIEREQQAAESARVGLATARPSRSRHRPNGRPRQAAEIERLRAALADAPTKAAPPPNNEAAVLAAKLEACADRVSRAEARVEQIEQQAAKAAQAHEEAPRRRPREARQGTGRTRRSPQGGCRGARAAARLAGQLEAPHREGAKSR